MSRKRDIDFEQMAARETKRRLESIKKALDKIATTGKTHDELLAIHRAASATWPDVESGWGKRGSFLEYLNALPSGNPVKIAREIKLWHCFDSLVGDYGVGVPENEPDPFAWANKQETFSCLFAMLRDGKWMERGDMGWWGWSR